MPWEWPLKKKKERKKNDMEQGEPLRKRISYSRNRDKDVLFRAAALRQNKIHLWLIFPSSLPSMKLKFLLPKLTCTHLCALQNQSWDPLWSTHTAPTLPVTPETQRRPNTSYSNRVLENRRHQSRGFLGHTNKHSLIINYSTEMLIGFQRER